MTPLDYIGVGAAIVLLLLFLWVWKLLRAPDPYDEIDC